MEYQVLARKWRPQQFDDVVGQEHVTTTLKNAIRRKRVGHSYLFTGPRGIGKTSTARILAKALNCANGSTETPCDACPSCTAIVAGNSMDVLEIDGASNRGIDQIRELRENVKFAPASSRYKIYIIDEVHQITADAFNALLKTLEEPPAHVKFFFATTEPQKVPSTILSRCQRFDLRAISDRELVERLARIAKSEKIKIDEEACFAIARYAQGSMRDAESILDQLVSFAEGAITAENVISMLGLVRESVLRDMTEALIGGDCRKGLEIIDSIAAEGKDLPLFLDDWIGYLRVLMHFLVMGGDDRRAGVSPASRKALEEQSARFPFDRLLYVLDVLARAEQQIRRALSPRILLELAFLKAARSAGLASVGEILKKLRELEERLGGSGEEPPRGGGGGGPDAPAARPAGGHARQPSPRARGEAGGREDAGRGPRAEAASAAAAPGGDEVVARVREVWHDVLERVAVVRPLLRSCLIEGVPSGFTDGVLRIEFPEDRAYQCDQLQHAGNKGLVRRVICELLGREVGVTLETAPRAPQEEAAKASVPRKEIQNMKKNPLIQSALEMFKAQVVEVKR